MTTPGTTPAAVSRRLTPIRAIGLVIVALGTLAAIYRLAFGLGAATNLNDGYPWGSGSAST